MKPPPSAVPYPRPPPSRKSSSDTGAPGRKTYPPPHISGSQAQPREGGLQVQVTCTPFPNPHANPTLPIPTPLLDLTRPQNLTDHTPAMEEFGGSISPKATPRITDPYKQTGLQAKNIAKVDLSGNHKFLTDKQASIKCTDARTAS